MNTNLDTALNYIWHSCQSEPNANRNPPDYWFSFSRRYREPLDGIMSKDMVQSYVTAPERSRASHPYAYGLRRVDGRIPAQQDIVEVTGEEAVYEAVDDRDGEDNTRDHRHPDPTYHGVDGYPEQEPEGIKLRRLEREVNEALSTRAHEVRVERDFQISVASQIAARRKTYGE